MGMQLISRPKGRTNIERVQKQSAEKNNGKHQILLVCSETKKWEDMHHILRRWEKRTWREEITWET